MDVLVVDDELNIRELCQRGLDGEFSVTVAETGEEAKRLLAAKPFDVLLSDIQMDPPGGLQLAKHVRQSYPRTDVILLTGYPSMDTVIEAQKWAVYDYLLKPLDLMLVKASLRRCRQRRAFEEAALRADGELAGLETSLAGLGQRLGALHRDLSSDEFSRLLGECQGSLREAAATAASVRHGLRALAEPKKTG